MAGNTAADLPHLEPLPKKIGYGVLSAEVADIALQELPEMFWDRLPRLDEGWKAP